MKRVEIVTPKGEVLLRETLRYQNENNLGDGIDICGCRLTPSALRALGLSIREVPEPVEFEATIDVEDKSYGTVRAAHLLRFTGRKVRVRVEVIE